MSGPNSAPNGDGRLVRGSKHEEFVYDEKRKEWVSLRVKLARDGRLETGKTARSK
jgi:hypothetical protein